jgi:hypothetical protein
MFSINELKMMNTTVSTTESGDKKASKYKNKTPPNIYSNIYMSPFVESKSDNEVNTQMIDSILEKEKQLNKSETWNKLNKTIKIQKLHSYAEKYAKEHKINEKDTKTLKTFFVSCLEKNKLQKSKDLLYNKETQEISDIPSLVFHHEIRNFTLKNMDKSRVSTLKSLTPKKTPIIIVGDNIPCDDLVGCVKEHSPITSAVNTAM